MDNHEHAGHWYDLTVTYNNSTEEKVAYLEHFFLEDNGTWQMPFVIRPDIPGDRVKIGFQVYKEGDMSSPYRECHLWMNVSLPYNYSQSPGRVTTMTTAIVKDEKIDYCREAPFHPRERYPEYPFGQTGGRNAAYAAIRELFRLAGMDESRYGSASWNPLGEIIRPGDHVLIKPNFVRHYNKAGGIEPLITHGSVIRAMLDYAVHGIEGTQGRSPLPMPLTWTPISTRSSGRRASTESWNTTGVRTSRSG